MTGLEILQLCWILKACILLMCFLCLLGWAWKTKKWIFAVIVALATLLGCFQVYGGERSIVVARHVEHVVDECPMPLVPDLAPPQGNMPLLVTLIFAFFLLIMLVAGACYALDKHYSQKPGRPPKNPRPPIHPRLMS